MTLKSSVTSWVKWLLDNRSFLSSVFSVVIFLQNSEAQIPVTGFVYSEQGNHLADVQILDPVSGRSTHTDSLGFFELLTSPGAILQFSRIGFAIKEQKVRGRSELIIVLREGIDLPDVVVTALGVERPVESLTFSQQVFDGASLFSSLPSTLPQALSGRLAGMVFSQSSAGLGASSRIILRGNRSLVGNNQPLYVVDGIPISNFSVNPASALGGFDYGDGISNLNLEDIESVSVLKGPSAAALYGTRANNGVILITTRSGQISDKVSLEYHSTFQIESAYELRDLQNQFGQGNGGVYNRRSEQNWGPPLDGRSVQHWSQEARLQDQSYDFNAQPGNYLDFYRPGSNWTNTLQISGGGEKMSSYFSYSFSDAMGIVPTSSLQSHQLNYRTHLQIHSKLKFDGKLTYFNRQVDYRQPTGENYANTQRQILRIPRNIALTDARHFEYLNAEGQNRQNFWNPGSTSGENPYWTLHRNKIDDERNRVLGFGSLTFDLNDHITFLVRSGLDRSFDNIEHRFFNDTYVLAPNGNYITNTWDILELNSDFLATISKTENPDWQWEASAGGSIRANRISGRQFNTGGLIKENLFSFDNARNPDIIENLERSRLHSLYAFGWIGYRNSIYAEVSGRNDWSSTLPRDQWSFFYPSLGTSVLLHKLIGLPSWLSRMKVRASYALVGNDVSPYLNSTGFVFSSGGALGYLSGGGVQPFSDLRPELTHSLELGTELTVGNERFNLDITYYKSNSKNQLLTIPLPSASGFSRRLINAGNIQNSGLEIMADYEMLRNRNFSWNTAINFATNKSKVIALSEEIKTFQLASDFMNTVQVDEGGEYGEIYSRGFLRNDQGQIMVGSDGLPEISPGQSVHLGSYNPDWTGGMENRIRFQSFELSFLFDFRLGGVVTSFTNANLYADGSSSATLFGRDGDGRNVVNLDPVGNIKAQIQGNQGLIIEGVKDDGTTNDIVVKTEDFWRKVGARNTATGEAFTSDASNIRLREFNLRYTLSQKMLENIFINKLSLAVFGRNLFFVWNKADGFDPELVVGAGNATQGLESFSLPATRVFGVQLSADF